MKKYNVILSGGVGTRLWPLSREACPKQFLKIFAGRSLFQQTLIRNAGLCDASIMIGNKATEVLWNEQLAELDARVDIELIEATPRNTAAAIAFAALSVDPDDILFVTPCDHQILDNEAYEQAVKRAIQLALEGKLVTFGIKPVSAHTGYGYIKHKGESVLAFTEKPDSQTAKEFLKTGGYLWNSGMFCFTAGKFLEELNKYQPDVLQSAQKTLELSDLPTLHLESSMSIPSISVDYAVMEKSLDIAVIPSFFSWYDLGSYIALKEFYEETNDGHFFNNGNLVFSNKRQVSILGIENLIVVDDDDVLLISNKEGIEKIKNEYLKVTSIKPNCR